MNTKGRFTFRSVVVLAALGAAMLFSGPAFAGHEPTSGEESAPKQSQEQDFIGPTQDEVLTPANLDSGSAETQGRESKPKPPPKELEPPKQPALLKVVVGHPEHQLQGVDQSGIEGVNTAGLIIEVRNYSPTKQSLQDFASKCSSRHP